MNVRTSVGALTATALLAGLTACGGTYAFNDKHSDAAGDPVTDAITAVTGALGGAAPGGGGTDPGQVNPNDPYAGGPPTSAPPYTIVMKSIAFFPTVLKTEPGKVWAIDNQDVAIHDVRTQDNKTIFSGDVQPGGKGSVKMPMKPGKYEAVCYYHQSMVIDITVTK
jgi:plastocyanin